MSPLCGSEHKLIIKHNRLFWKFKILKGKDHKRNVTGENGKSITKYLKEIGKGKNLCYHNEITDAKGELKVIKGRIEGKSKNGTINQLFAMQLMTKALKGDLKAIQEVLDRTEGRPKQIFDMENLFTKDTVINVDYV